jgi:hypothetical protein
LFFFFLFFLHPSPVFLHFSMDTVLFPMIFSPPDSGVHGAPNGAGLGGGVGGPAAPASGLFKGAAPLPAPNGFQTVMSAARMW